MTIIPRFPFHQKNQYLHPKFWQKDHLSILQLIFHFQDKYKENDKGKGEDKDKDTDKDKDKGKGKGKGEV